jgi:hypothetical protein
LKSGAAGRVQIVDDLEDIAIVANGGGSEAAGRATDRLTKMFGRGIF